MILRPITSLPSARSGVYVPAWDAIARQQNRPADDWWLVSQPEHAALAGAVAAAFVSPQFPAVDSLMAKAIGLHDAGWGLFDSEADVHRSPLLREGRPLSFFEIGPADFLRAWTASIDRAEDVSPAGGYVVCRHFATLGAFRLLTAQDSEQDRMGIETFLGQAAARQERLSAAASVPPRDLERLLLVLQFCDLLSLYLCCGSNEAVEFPQEFAAGRVRLSPRDGAFFLQPSPFRARGKSSVGVSIAVQARRYPFRSTGADIQPLAFLLW